MTYYYGLDKYNNSIKNIGLLFYTKCVDMEQIIYGDILFIVNFSMDFLALFITAKIMHMKLNIGAPVLAAAIGSFYAVASIFYSGNAIISLFLHIGVSFLMCYIVFGTGGLLFFIRSSLLFWAVSFSLGGTMTALFNLVNRQRSHVFMNGNITEVYSEISITWIVLFAVLSGFISIISGRLFRQKNAERMVNVTAEFEGKKIILECICDSGNFLREPASARPVIITCYNNLYPLLPQELRYAFKRKNTTALSEINIKYIKHIRIIPISTVGHSGILLGFLPDRITVDGIDREACIAIDNNDNPVNVKNGYNGYAAVVPSVLVK